MTMMFAKTFSAVSFLILPVLIAASSAHAQSDRTTARENIAGDDTPTIFDVRKSLPMEPTDPTYHDFYINAGSEAGFKKGQYVPVARAIPVHDPVQNKQQGILTIPVGKVFVIHVERGMTVARLASELGDDERPTLEYEAIMIGDRVDMKGITTEAPSSTGKKKKKTAAVEAPAAVSVVQSEATIAPATTASAAPSVAPAAESKTETTSVASDPTAADPVKTDKAASTQPTETPVKSPSAPQRVTQPVPPPTA